MLEKDLNDESLWYKFLEYKLSKDFVSNKEKEILKDFIENKKYEAICTGIINGTYSFSVPKKHLISKGHSQKNRIE